MIVTAVLVSATAMLGTLATAAGKRRIIITSIFLICLTFALSYLASRPSRFAYDLLAPLHQVFDPIVNLVYRWA